jgi:hypothetical protein
MTPSSIRDLANPFLLNEVACFQLKKLDRHFIEIIKHDSEKFSDRVFSKYYQMCKKNHIITDTQPPSWGALHFNEHPAIRMAAIAEVMHEICLTILEEQRGINYRITQLTRDIELVSKTHLVIDHYPSTISSDHLESFQSEINLLREKIAELSEENTSLKKVNLAHKRTQSQNQELWEKLTDGAIITLSPLRKIPLRTPPS